MASGHRRPTKYPHFFKIIVPHTISSGKLMIPKMFASKYGKTLLDSVVYLKVPNGRVWEIDVTRKNGEVSLHGRWTEFAEHYSLELGYMLVFGHEGNSTFSVVIFDKSASEIEYPPCNIHGGQEPITPPKTQPCNEDAISDDSVQITRCQKRKGNSSIRDTVRRPKRIKLEKSNEELHHSVQDVEESGCISKAHRRAQSKILATITPEEKARALEKSVSFESNNPYFKIVMQPANTHSYLGVPVEFSEKHFTHRKGDVSLRTSDGRAWSVRYDYIVKNNKRQARLYCGWKSFVKDNVLVVGDVCVFEMKDPTKFSFQVVIFRARTDKNGQGSQESGCISKAHRRARFEILATITPAEKARALEKSVSFESNNPYFKIVMQPAYTRSYLAVPVDFSEKHFTHGKGDVSLRTSDGRAWSVRYDYIVRNKKRRIRLSCGWKSFVKDNVLEVGDVCVFELKDPTKFSFQVVIFRFRIDENGPGSQDKGSVADGAKMKGSNKEPKMEASVTNVHGHTHSSDALPLGRRKDVKGISKKLKYKVPILGRVVKLLLSCSEVPRALEEAKKFVSEHPRFILYMASGYMSRTTMGVPRRFVKKYLQKRVTKMCSAQECAAQVTLHVADRVWNVNLLAYPSGSCKMTGGWPAFAKGNNLGHGDACVFELVDIPNVVMKVTIFRCVSYKRS